MGIGVFLGVRIRVSWMFLALAALGTYYGYGVGVAIATVSVLFHEMAHALVASAYGLIPEEIELLPFGGIARLKGLLELHPEAEAGVALAGPLNSLFLAGILHLLLTYGILNGDWARTAITVNLALGAFNAIPLLPLDGGRILRSRISRRIGYVEGTRRLASMGMVVSFLACTASGILFFMGFTEALTPGVAMAFVALGAMKEYRAAGMAIMRYLVSRKEILMGMGLMQVEAHIVLEGVPARRLVRRITPRRYHIYYVTRDGSDIARVLTEAQMIEGFLNGGPNATVGDIWKGNGGNGAPGVES